MEKETKGDDKATNHKFDRDLRDTLKRLDAEAERAAHVRARFDEESG